MALIQVRKFQTTVEKAYHEGGPARNEPLLRGSISAVVQNPYAGRFEENLVPFMEALDPLAHRMAAELLAALGGDARHIEGYGKGAIVGADGELEHGAVWHVPAGAGLRAVLGQPKAQVPSSKKVGAIGAVVDIPMVYVHASYLRSHYDVVPVVVADAPRPREIVYALVMTTEGRIHARIGGFTKDQVKGEDGLR